MPQNSGRLPTSYTDLYLKQNEKVIYNVLEKLEKQN